MCAEKKEVYLRAGSLLCFVRVGALLERCPALSLFVLLLLLSGAGLCCCLLVSLHQRGNFTLSKGRAPNA